MPTTPHAWVAPLAGRATDAASAEALAHGIGARLDAIPQGRAGPLGATQAALELGGFPVPAPHVGPQVPLAVALQMLYDAEGVAVPRERIASAVAGVPAELRAPLADLVATVARAHAEASRILPADDIKLLAGDLTLTTRLASLGTTSGDARVAALWDARAAALSRVDRAALAQASVDVAAAVARFDAPARAASATTCDKILSLPLVEVGDACDDTYDALDLVTVDLGGNDVYLNGAGSGVAGAGVGVALDLGEGNDTYRSASFAQGFGLAGVGLLYDEGGSDVYSAMAFAQGSSTAGAGILYDAGAGNDQYLTDLVENSTLTKAATLGGVGVLVDEGGDDVYQQGGLDGFDYGAAGGVALLVDEAGDDQYLSPDLHVFLDTGTGIAQDFGMMTGPVQVSSEVGGTSILDDRAGDDLYQCGDHVRQGCQASAGLGSFALLLDRAGNDQYRMGVEVERSEIAGIGRLSMGQGGSYGQATPPAPATAILDDRAGDDVYHAEMWAQGYGSGSLGALVDEGGHDAYETVAPLVGSRVDGASWADGAGGAGADLS